MKFRLFLLLAGSPFAHCAIVFNGNPITGSPTPSLQITAPIVLTSTTTTPFLGLILDNWVTNDGSNTTLSFVSGTLLSYQINGGATQTLILNSFRDNLITDNGALSVNDGMLIWGGSAGVTVPIGQTFTLLPGTFVFNNPNAAFNPNVPTNYQGPVFAYGAGAVRTSEIANAPEPTTAVLAALGSLVLIRRRR